MAHGEEPPLACGWHLQFAKPVLDSVQGALQLTPPPEDPGHPQRCVPSDVLPVPRSTRPLPLPGALRFTARAARQGRTVREAPTGPPAHEALGSRLVSGAGQRAHGVTGLCSPRGTGFVRQVAPDKGLGLPQISAQRAQGSVTFWEYCSSHRLCRSPGTRQFTKDFVITGHVTPHRLILWTPCSENSPERTTSPSHRERTSDATQAVCVAEPGPRLSRPFPVLSAPCTGGRGCTRATQPSPSVGGGHPPDSHIAQQLGVETPTSLSSPYHTCRMPGRALWGHAWQRQAQVLATAPTAG